MLILKVWEWRDMIKRQYECNLIMMQDLIGGGKMDEFTERIEKLRTFASGKSAIVGMTTSGSFNILGDDGRCSIIGNEVGFNNIGAAEGGIQALDIMLKNLEEGLGF